MYWLCVVISVNCYILFAQVAAVAKITCLSRTQIHSYYVLNLRDNLACLFSVKPCRFAIFKDGYTAEFAAEPIWVQFYAG